MLTIDQCTIADLEDAPNIWALLDEYAAESSIKGLPSPNAKATVYKALESTGALTVFRAVEDGELIGFLLMLAPVIPHYGRVIATTESLFVTASRRKSGAGLRLIAAMREKARELGSPGILISAPLGGQLAEVLSRMDFVETNRVFFQGISYE